MNPLLTQIVLRLLACGAAAWLLWGLLQGPLGLVFAAPLFGIALARPVLELLGLAYATTRELAMSPLEGRHFAHRGVPLDIAEDERHHRWVRVRDLRRLLPGLPRDASLRRQFPQGLLLDGRRGLRIDADTLLECLCKATDPDSLKFRNWLEREVVMPAATLRRRRGIKDDNAEGPETEAPPGEPGP